MASSCSADPGSSTSAGASCEDDANDAVEQKKRKRMQSNRESAKRSRIRRQKHLDYRMSQIDQLKKDKDHILFNSNVLNERYLEIEAENSILSAQRVALERRLNSLNEILSCLALTDAFHSEAACETDYVDLFMDESLSGLCNFVDDCQSHFLVHAAAR